MTTDSNINAFWFRSLTKRRSLPAHLPRLLLAPRYQPRFVRRCRVTQRISRLLQMLDWEPLPMTLAHKPTGGRSVPVAAYLGAYLIKLDQGLRTFGQLRHFLRDHPALVWALGFPLAAGRAADNMAAAEAALPSQRHFSRKLSRLPNDVVQLLLDGQVAWLLRRFGDRFGDTVSIDTKHILAWVRENNAKAYIKEGRYDKQRQPKGDRDCRLGCKRRRNQTPTKEGEPASGNAGIGEFYWGYAAGVVATKMADVGEFVLAELTQTFDHGDLTYFLPLMAQVEQRLGRRPRYGAADAAFDSFYTHDYFRSPEHDGFAAIPLRRLGYERTFDENGLPLCEAGLAMPLASTYTNRTSLVQHKRGRYVCPLLHPEPNGKICPINHKKWPDGGCKTVMPTAIGARLRYQLDRESDRFKRVYNQRTAVERIFSQATALGIERPKLRNQQAIANLNTLTFVLINLRAMLRCDAAA